VLVGAVHQRNRPPSIAVEELLATFMGGEQGHHFARWNEGAYWWALKEIIREYCKSEFTSCVTFSERIRLEEIHFFN